MEFPYCYNGSETAHVPGMYGAGIVMVGPGTQINFCQTNTLGVFKACNLITWPNFLHHSLLRELSTILHFTKWKVGTSCAKKVV